MESAGKKQSQNKQLSQRNILFWPLLKSVSRSFYLSLRYLPNAVRLPLSLAYLLARVTDTLADYSTIPVMFRKEMMAQLKILVSEPSHFFLLSEVNQNVKPYLSHFSDSDRALIENIPFLFELLHEQSAQDKIYIQDVLNKIIEGQLIDLNYFDSQKGIVHFSTDEELDNYLYLVAGCVGEFWTKLCCSYIPGYTKDNLSSLLLKAINFGKALQLTNILRDLPCDLANGRLYLPYQGSCSQDNLEQFVNELSIKESALIERWRSQALDYLSDAALYIQAVNNRRVKFACLVPYFIAKETLNTLKDLSYIAKRQAIKISRKQVYLYLWKALYTRNVATN
ncbi:squalene/phytoene synthase family protein [Legionella fallonii]|uniref:Phytoene synthase n=1 Tax=Legionella fallonii LLAP-10 TaxID=1212491 RepID=A0A098GAG8_9GAMM|nr:squalene/phytoene synthase family protein [Legionella fallonii]CEG58977.1 Phytoene synthase [Legionella fallonii LLAP-10]